MSSKQALKDIVANLLSTFANKGRLSRQQATWAYQTVASYIEPLSEQDAEEAILRSLDVLRRHQII